MKSHQCKGRTCLRPKPLHPAELKLEFEDMRGLSVRNLKYMRAFAEVYSQFMQSSTAQLQITKNALREM